MAGVTGLGVVFLMGGFGYLIYLVYKMMVSIRQARSSAPDATTSSGEDADESSVSSDERGGAKKHISLKKLRPKSLKKPKSTDVWVFIFLSSNACIISSYLTYLGLRYRCAAFVTGIANAQYYYDA